MSFGRTKQLQDLKQIIEAISNEIMWVNDREEEELVFDWGEKNVNQYIPKKQESYSVRKTLDGWELFLFLRALFELVNSLLQLLGRLNDTDLLY